MQVLRRGQPDRDRNLGLATARTELEPRDVGQEFVRHGERILLTALGVRPNSQVTFKFTRTEDGVEVATHQSASVNRNCIMNQEYVALDTTRFPAGDYKIFAEYKDGNSDAVITKDEIGAIKVKPLKGN